MKAATHLSPPECNEFPVATGFETDFGMTNRSFPSSPKPVTSTLTRRFQWLPPEEPQGTHEHGIPRNQHLNRAHDAFVEHATAIVLFVGLGLRHTIIHVDSRERHLTLNQLLQLEGTCIRFLNDGLPHAKYCKHIAALAAVVVAVVAVVAVAFASRCSTTCSVLSLHFLNLLSAVLLSLHLSLSSTTLVAARHVLLQPFAVRSVGPPRTPPPCHVFGTSMFSLNCLVSSPPFSSKHSSRAFLHSCLSWASCTLLSLSCSSLIFSSHFLLSSSRSHSSRVLFWRQREFVGREIKCARELCDTEKQGKTTLDHETWCM